MSYAERQYRVLLVSTGDKFIKEISGLLRDDRYHKDYSHSASDARCKLLENPYDIVIVNAPLTDEFGSRLCFDAGSNNGTIAMIFASNDVFEDIYAKASAHGVFVLQKPTSKNLVSQAMSLMISARERLRAVEEKADKAAGKLDEVRVVNKAKWMLIDHEGMSEADAHKYIEKSAMDAGIAKKLAAQMIIDNYY